jgi:transposase-like protein
LKTSFCGFDPKEAEVTDDRLQEAVRVAVTREERREHPRGEWRARLWYPAPDERRVCCEGILPTAANRQALESHCRTQRHVALLFDISPSALRQAVKRAREAAGSGLPLRSRIASEDQAEALYEASREVQQNVLLWLRTEAESFQEMLPRLLAVTETSEDFGEIFEQVAVSLDRLRLTLDCCRKVEATCRGAQEIREITSNLSALVPRLPPNRKRESSRAFGEEALTGLSG